MSKLKKKSLWEVVEELQYHVYDAITETRCEIDYYFVKYVSECNLEGTSICMTTRVRRCQSLIRRLYFRMTTSRYITKIMIVVH